MVEEFGNNMIKEGQEEDLREASNLANKSLEANWKTEEKTLLSLKVVVFKYRCVLEEVDLISGVFPKLLSLPGVQ